MTKILAMATISVILGIACCSTEDKPKHEHKDFALIEVHEDSSLVAIVGAVPGDTVVMGKYTVIYNKRK